MRFAQHAELGDADLDARRLEVLEQEAGDSLGKGLDEAEALFRQEGADVLHYDAVVDGVRDLSRLENRVTRKSDFEVDLDRLRRDLLVAIEPDPRLKAQLTDENGV